MASWLIHVSENYLVVMYEWLHAKLKDRPIVNADETHEKINQYKELAPLTDDQGNLLDKEVVRRSQKELDAKAREESEDGKLHKKHIFMWLYSSRYGTDAPIVLYDYQPSRSGACCEAFLGKDFCGYLMVDGYSGYNVLDAAVRCCCLGHFRSY